MSIIYPKLVTTNQSPTGIPPTLCKKRGKKRHSILGKKRIFKRKRGFSKEKEDFQKKKRIFKRKRGFSKEKEEKERHTVFVRRKLKPTGTIILQIR
jgi:hypothetical protein